MHLLIFTFCAGLLSCSTSSKIDLKHHERFRLNELREVNSPSLSNYLTGISQKICQLHKLKCPRIAVVDTHDVQAMASVSSHTIYISRGMLYAIQNEAELMALVAHEVGHIKLKHGFYADEKNDKDANDLERMNEIIEGVTGVEIPIGLKSKLENMRQAQFFQKNEESADEFAVLTVSKLGYRPDSFADLFERLNKLDDKSLAEQINLFEGSHKTLGQRAQHIRNFIRTSKIKIQGEVKTDTYLIAINSLASQNKKVEYNKKTEEILNKILQQVATLQKQQKRLTVAEFLNVMTSLRQVAIDFGVLTQLQEKSLLSLVDRLDSDAQNPDQFMMELIRLSRPLWPEDTNAVKIFNALISLGRMSVGSLPVVGDAIDLYEVIVGRDFYTDEPLNTLDRVGSGLGVIAGAGEQWRASAGSIGQVYRMAHDSQLEKKFRLIKDEDSYKTLSKLADDINSKNIPNDWRVKATRIKDSKTQGLEFVHPERSDIRVRIMPGDPKAKHPNSRTPYARQTVSGKSYDKNGRFIADDTNEAHIPIEDFQFSEFWKINDKN